MPNFEIGLLLDWNSNAWRVFVRRETEENFKNYLSCPNRYTEQVTLRRSDIVDAVQSFEKLEHKLLLFAPACEQHTMSITI